MVGIDADTYLSLVYYPLSIGLMSNTGSHTHMLHIFLPNLGPSLYEIFSYSRRSVGVMEEIRRCSKIDGLLFHRETKLTQGELRVIVDSTPGTKKRYIKKLSTTEDNFFDSSGGSEPNHFVRGESHNPL
jgi:hypothetical protein